MKSIMFATSTLLFTAALLLIAGCNKDEENPVNKHPELIKRTWTLQRVTIDGVDHTTEFEGLKVTFNDGNSFASSLDLPHLTLSGTYTLTSPTEMKLNEISCTLERLTSTELIFEFEWDKTTYGGGRDFSIAGKHRFVFSN